MKNLVAIILLSSAYGLTGAQANAESKIQCFTSDSKSMITQNRHCESKCKRHADRQPILEIKMVMPKKWGDKGAFYRNPSINCSGGNGCGYADLGPAIITDGGQTAQATFKTWSIPATITLTANICILE